MESVRTTLSKSLTSYARAFAMVYLSRMPLRTPQFDTKATGPILLPAFCCGRP